MIRIKAKPGEPIEIPLGVRCRLVCCDCRLVHDFIVKRQGMKYTITFSRNRRLTVRRRKQAQKSR